MSDSPLPSAPKPPVKSGIKTYLWAGVALAALVGAGGWWAYQNMGKSPQVGAGQPLNQSASHISVLKAPEAETAQPVTSSAELLPSAAQISLAQGTQAGAAAQPTPPPAPKPVVFDKTAVQLGTTISLLAGSWGNGGTLPRQLADTAAALAEKTGQHAVMEAAETLRAATPREGPVTLSLMLVQINQVAALQPPENLPEDDAAAQAQKSWLRKQLEQLISISSTPQTQNRWSVALRTVQQQIARGMVADAFTTLTEAPLAGDDRLAPLRASVRGYLDQTGKLNNLAITYTNLFLKAGGQ